jgi:hypothetical protein
MKITIPEPCDQKWSEMQACGSNRFCNKCEKQIIDFTYYSDAALIKVIEENDGRICGKFTKDQLDRELISSYKKQSFFSNISARWLGLWLFLSSPFYSVKAQTPTEVSPELKTTKTDTNLFYISGTVVGEDGQPILDAKVKIIELGQETLTDSNGKFKIVFEDSSFGKYTIEITGNGLTEVLGYGFDDTTKISNVSPNTSNIQVVLSRNVIEVFVGIIDVDNKFDVLEPKNLTPRRHRRSKNRN